VVQLLVLLQQLNTSAGGLGALPETELGEVIAKRRPTVRFFEPNRGARHDCHCFGRLKMQDPIPEHP
jgi:hypothetical protein